METLFIVANFSNARELKEGFMFKLVPERQSIFIGIDIICLMVRGDGFAVNAPIEGGDEHVF